MQCPKCHHEFRGKVCPDCGTDITTYRPPQPGSTAVSDRYAPSAPPSGSAQMRQATVANPRPEAQGPKAAAPVPPTPPRVTYHPLQQKKSNGFARAIPAILVVVFSLLSFLPSLLDDIAPKKAPTPVPDFQVTPPQIDSSILDLMALTGYLTDTSATQYKPGDYTIGSNLPAGEYFILSSEWVTLSTTVGESPAQTYDFYGTRYVTLPEGAQFSFDSGIMVPAAMVKASSLAQEQNWYEYMYKVGVDLPAGQYTLHATDSEEQGYYEITSDSSGTEGGLLEVDFFDGDTVVTLEEGQYLLTSFCEIVTGQST